MPQDIIRALAPSERVYVQFAQGCGVLGCIELNQPLNVQQLSTALALLKQQHPLIGAVIQKPLDEYCFCQASRRDIPLEVCSDGDFKKTYQQALNVPFDLGDALVQAFYNEGESSSYLVILFHHSVADGTSVSSFLHQLLSIYTDNSTALETASVPLAIDSLLPTIAEDPKALREAEQDKVDQLQPIIVPDQPERALNTTPEMFVANLQLSEEQLQQLKVKCKASDCTINSSLSAALILAVEQLVQQPQQEHAICIKYALDLRRRLQPAIDSSVQCSAVTAYNDIYSFTGNNDFWSFAHFIKQQQHAYLADNGPVKSTIAMLRSGSMVKNSNVALMISNVGIIKTAADYRGLKILDAHIHATVYAPRPVATLLTVNGRLNIDITYTQPYTSELYMQQLMAALDNILIENL